MQMRYGNTGTGSGLRGEKWLNKTCGCNEVAWIISWGREAGMRRSRGDILNACLKWTASFPWEKRAQKGAKRDDDECERLAASGKTFIRIKNGKTSEFAA